MKFTYIIFNPHNNPIAGYITPSLIIPISLIRKLRNLSIIIELINCVRGFEAI